MYHVMGQLLLMPAYLFLIRFCDGLDRFKSRDDAAQPRQARLHTEADDDDLRKNVQGHS